MNPRLMFFLTLFTISMRIRDLTKFLKGIFEYDLTLLNETNHLMICLLDVLKRKLENHSLPILEIAHIANDVDWLSNLDKFIFEEIEIHTKCSFTLEMAFKAQYRNF